MEKKKVKQMLDREFLIGDNFRKGFILCVSRYIGKLEKENAELKKQLQTKG